MRKNRLSTPARSFLPPAFLLAALALGFSAGCGARTHLDRGIAFLEDGRDDRAIAAFNKAIARDPNLAAAYGNRGIAYASKGELDHAIADFSKAIAINPNDVQAHYNRGTAYLQQGDYDRAIADFDRMIALNPNLPLAYNSRATAWLRKKEYDRAWEDVKRCREAGGTPSEAVLELLRQASGRKE